jgi:hypothetical protein
MINRVVTKSGKDSDGDITSLCGAWGSTAKSLAITEIELGTHRYFTRGSDNSEADVEVVKGANGKYLRTVPDDSLADNLADLPDC